MSETNHRPPFISRSHGRRILSGIAVGAAAVLALSGCIPGGGSNESGDLGAKPAELSGNLSFWTINLKSGFADYINGLIDGFQAENPKVKIEWVDVPGDEIDSKFLAALSGKNVPDVVNLFSDTVPGVASRMLDLTKVMSPEAIADFQPGLRDPFKIDGSQVAVPWYHGGVPVTAYRSSIMSQVPGFDITKPPATYDELLDLAQKTHDATGKYGVNILPTDSIFQYYGIPMLNADKTEAAFNTPEAVALLEKFKAGYESGAIAPGSTSTQGIPPQWIDSGETGFVVNSPSIFLGLKDTAPEAFNDLELSVAPATADGKYLLTEIQTFVVPAGTKNPYAAGAFLEYITNAANQLAFSELVAIYPSSATAAKDPFFSDFSEQSLNTDARKLVASSLPNLVYVGSFGTKFDSELGKVFRDAMRDYMSGTESASDALTAVAEKWKGILAG